MRGQEEQSPKIDEVMRLHIVHIGSNLTKVGPLLHVLAHKPSK